MGEFLMWNPFAQVFALMMATVSFIVVGEWIFKLADPKAKKTASPVWSSVSKRFLYYFRLDLVFCALVTGTEDHHVNFRCKS